MMKDISEVSWRLEKSELL